MRASSSGNLLKTKKRDPRLTPRLQILDHLWTVHDAPTNVADLLVVLWVLRTHPELHRTVCEAAPNHYTTVFWRIRRLKRVRPLQGSNGTCLQSKPSC